MQPVTGFVEAIALLFVGAGVPAEPRFFLEEDPRQPQVQSRGDASQASAEDDNFFLRFRRQGRRLPTTVDQRASKPKRA